MIGRDRAVRSRACWSLVGAVVLGAALVTSALWPSEALAEPAGTGDAGGPALGVAPTTSIVAAGDVACGPPVNLALRSCSQGRTAALVRRLAPEAVLMLGDAQYGRGSPAEFAARDAYRDTWGRFAGRTIPVAGNHDWETPGAAGYRGVFDARTGGRFYYSRTLSNGWHVIALDSDCRRVGGCGPTSRQMQWLRSDLVASDGRPTIVMWHHPRWSSGSHGDNAAVDTLWRVAAGDRDVQIVLNGHEHNYERLRPMSPDGQFRASGARTFIVGTGGIGLRQAAPGPRDARSALFAASSHGVLRLDLRPAGYSWRFVATNGAPADAGTSGLR